MRSFFCLLLVLGLFLPSLWARDMAATRARFSELHSEEGFTMAELGEMVKELSGREAANFIIERMEQISDFTWPGINLLARRATFDKLQTYYVMRHAFDSRDPQDLRTDDIIGATEGMRASEKLEMTLAFLPRLVSGHRDYVHIRKIAVNCLQSGRDRQKVLEAAMRLLNRQALYLFDIVPLAQCIGKTNVELEFIAERLDKIANLDLQMVRLIAREVGSGFESGATCDFIQAGLTELGNPKMTTREFLRLVSFTKKSSQRELILNNLEYVTDLSTENIDLICDEVSDEYNRNSVREAAEALL